MGQFYAPGSAGAVEIFRSRSVVGFRHAYRDRRPPAGAWAPRSGSRVDQSPHLRRNRCAASGYTGDVATTGRADRFRTGGLTRATMASCRNARGLSGGFTARFTPTGFSCSRDYLRAHRDRYDEVLISDVRDVAFQAHPFTDIAQSRGPLLSRRRQPHDRQRADQHGLARLFLPGERCRTSSSPAASAAAVSVLGGMTAMTAYLDRMNADLAAVPMKVRRKIGADTAFHNRMGHLTKEIPVESWSRTTCTSQQWGSSRLRPTASARMAQSAPRDGTLPAILHQYDRLPEIKAPVEAALATKVANRLSCRRSRRFLGMAKNHAPKRLSVSGGRRML